MKFGIIREGKNPPDKRVPLSPSQCQQLLKQYPDLKIAIQPSPIRAFKDEEYSDLGLQLQEDLSDCEVLFGVKEVPTDMLIPNKTYLFFSHTYKLQPYNRGLLQAILQKKIRLIDYEMLKDKNDIRILGFGKYAGIVGAYNAFRAWGEMTNEFKLKPAHLCHDRKEMESELAKLKFSKARKIVLTGSGRVGGGAEEIMKLLNFTKVEPQDFLNRTYDSHVYCQLEVSDYFKRVDAKEFKNEDFYSNPVGYESNFRKYAKQADIYISCHFWSEKSPYIFSREDAKSEDFNIRLVSDISCDIDGPVASTLSPSTIENPFYGYDPIKEAIVDFGAKGSIGVSAVDNLPCELPRDASQDFGNELIKNVIPHFFNGDKDKILERASETDLHGKLSSYFSYLQDYVQG
tara:strand:- start:40075 stop:41280 length:1206 start_codon:yes stop_codon:yes gene_type:complete